jgi:hypothetical protein
LQAPFYLVQVNIAGFVFFSTLSFTYLFYCNSHPHFCSNICVLILVQFGGTFVVVAFFCLCLGSGVNQTLGHEYWHVLYHLPTSPLPLLTLHLV